MWVIERFMERIRCTQEVERLRRLQNTDHSMWVLKRATIRI